MSDFSSHKEITYHQFMKNLSLHQRIVDYNRLTSKNSSTESAHKQSIKLKPSDYVRLLFPYLGSRFGEQIKSVLPLALYLIFFQILILRSGFDNHWEIIGGITAAIVGLAFFMEGLKVGLMPLAEIIGGSIATKLSIVDVLIIALILGVVATFAEPAVGALQTVGSIIDPIKAPFLYALLNFWSNYLVIAVAIGVGIATLFGVLRLIYNWNLKPLIFIFTIPTLLLSLYCFQNPDL